MFPLPSVDVSKGNELNGFLTTWWSKDLEKIKITSLSASLFLMEKHLFNLLLRVFEKVLNILVNHIFCWFTFRASEIDQLLGAYRLLSFVNWKILTCMGCHQQVPQSCQTFNTMSVVEAFLRLSVLWEVSLTHFDHQQLSCLRHLDIHNGPKSQACNHHGHQPLKKSNMRH